MASSVAPAIYGFQQGQGEPATHLSLITPSDTLYLTYVTRAIRVGGAATIRTPGCLP